MSPATLLFGIALGIAIAAPWTYIWASRTCAKEARAEFKLRQIALQTHEGFTRKKFYVTLLERVEYKGIPLPWSTTKIPVAEKLDEDGLIAAAKAVSVIMSADLSGLGIEIVSRVLPKCGDRDLTKRRRAA